MTYTLRRPVIPYMDTHSCLLAHRTWETNITQKFHNHTCAGIISYIHTLKRAVHYQ